MRWKFSYYFPGREHNLHLKSQQPSHLVSFFPLFSKNGSLKVVGLLLIEKAGRKGRDFLLCGLFSYQFLSQEKKTPLFLKAYFQLFQIPCSNNLDGEIVIDQIITSVHFRNFLKSGFQEFQKDEFKSRCSEVEHQKPHISFLLYLT